MSQKQQLQRLGSHFWRRAEDDAAFDGCALTCHEDWSTQEAAEKDSVMKHDQDPMQAQLGNIDLMAAKQPLQLPRRQMAAVIQRRDSEFGSMCAVDDPGELWTTEGTVHYPFPV